MSKAVVLLSGGLDSATVLALARAEGHDCYALSFRYGQRHTVELEAAAKVARALGAVEHRVAEVDLRWIGGSALTADIAVPKDRGEVGGDIPVTYVPARNALFLTLALAWAEVLGARDLYAGMNALDYSGYPDCRPEFLRAYEAMANLGTKAGVEGAAFRIHAPLMAWARHSEITADRAGLLAVGSADVAARVLTQSTLRSLPLYQRLDLDEWRRQEEESDDSMLRAAEWTTSSTPFLARRLRLAREFAASEEVRGWRAVIDYWTAAERAANSTSAASSAVGSRGSQS